MGDVRERAAVDEHGVVLERLHDVGCSASLSSTVMAPEALSSAPVTAFFSRV